MTDKFTFLQEILMEELADSEEIFESPSVSLRGLLLYLSKFSEVIDMRDRGLSYTSGKTEPLPEFPRIFDRYDQSL